MNSVKFNLRENVKRFFRPFAKYPIASVIVSVIIGVLLFVCVDIVFAEVVQRNSHGMHMLTPDLVIEHGPSFADESRTHAKMIKFYVDHFEEGFVAAMLRILYPEYSPKKVLASKIEVLENVTAEEARESIWEAGLATNHLYLLGNRFPRSPIAWFKSKDLPPKLLAYLDIALKTSTELVDKLVKEPNRQAAIEACRVDRKSVLLLSLARNYGYDDEERVRSFLSDVTRSRDCIRELAKGEEDKKEQAFLYSVAESENRRVEILKAMLDNDMDRVGEVLREAIERAFAEREEAKSAEQGS